MGRRRASVHRTGGRLPAAAEGDWVSEFLGAGVDFERANAARMYDYFLGGGHNFAVDREQAAQVVARHPDFVRVCQANRSYLARVVRACGERGIDQFLDLGSGVPTVGNVHEIAQRIRPDARVAYVDIEPVATTYAATILAGDGGATITRADLRDVDAVLRAPGVAGLLDFSRPVALLAVAVLHFLPGDLVPVLAAYRRALVPGSLVVLSHGSDDQDDPDLAARARASSEQYRTSDTPATARSRAELRRVLSGLELVPPGLVDLVAWPEKGDDEPVGIYAAVARVPHGEPPQPVGDTVA